MLRSLELSLKGAVRAVLRLLFRSRRPAEPFGRPFQRILVIRQHNQLGDMLCVVPLLRALRSRYPGAHIALMTSPVNHEVMRNNRYLNETILYDKREFLGGNMLRAVRFVRELKGRKFDLALVPGTVSTSLTSDLLAFLSRAPVRVGVESLDGRENPSSFFFNVPVPLDWRSDLHRHQTLRNMDIVGEAGIGTPDLSLEITLTVEEEREGTEYLQRVKGGKRLAIGYHPGAGKPPNRWPSEKFAQLINALTGERRAAAIITSGPMDDEQLSIVRRELALDAEVLENRPIRFVASVLKGLDLYITNDTGLMHVAGAVGVPVLSLFGPTDALQWAPIGPRNRSIQMKGQEIGEITLDEVLREARSILDVGGRS